MKMETEGVSINIHDIKKGSLFVDTLNEKIHSIFVLDGEIQIESINVSKGAFITISKTNSFEIYCKKKSTIFEVISPLYPSYRTYS